MSPAICNIVNLEPSRTRVRRAGEAASVLEPRVRDWLETQSVIVEDWLNQLVAHNGDARLIGLLSQHAAFLRDTLEEG
jgi:hypothetical protein